MCGIHRHLMQNEIADRGPRHNSLLGGVILIKPGSRLLLQVDLGLLRVITTSLG